MLLGLSRPSHFPHFTPNYLCNLCMPAALYARVVCEHSRQGRMLPAVKLVSELRPNSFPGERLASRCHSLFFFSGNTSVLHPEA